MCRSETRLRGEITHSMTYDFDVNYDEYDFIC